MIPVARKTILLDVLKHLFISKTYRLRELSTIAKHISKTWRYSFEEPVWIIACKRKNNGGASK